MKKNVFGLGYIAYIVVMLLCGCESASVVLEGEKVSIFDVMEDNEVIDKKIILERPVINTRWGNDGGDGLNNVGHVAGRKSWEKLFSVDVGSVSDTGKILYTSVSDGERVFTVDGKLRVVAVSLKTGKKLWKTEKFDNVDVVKFGALALSDDGKDLFLITNAGQLVDIDASNGDVKYSKYFNTEIKSGLSFCSGKIIFMNDMNEMYVIDASSGEKLYVHKSIEENSEFVKGAVPMCDGARLVVPFSNGEVHMLMIETGTPIWMGSLYHIATSKLNNISDIIANPVSDGKIVVVKDYNDLMKAFDLDSGEEKWVRHNGGIVAPVISNDVLFDIDNNKVVRAIDLDTGKVIWSVRINIGRGDVVFSPILMNNQLLVPVSNGDIVKINPYDGKIIAIDNLVGEIDVEPIVIKDKLIILSNAVLKVFR